MCWNLPSSNTHMEINTAVLSGCLSLVREHHCQLHLDTPSCYHQHSVMQDWKDGNFRAASALSNGHGSFFRCELPAVLHPATQIAAPGRRGATADGPQASQHPSVTASQHDTACLLSELLFPGPSACALCTRCLPQLPPRVGVASPRNGANSMGEQVVARWNYGKEMKFPLFWMICSLCTEIILIKQVLLHHMSRKKSH